MIKKYKYETGDNIAEDILKVHKILYLLTSCLNLPRCSSFYSWKSIIQQHINLTLSSKLNISIRSLRKKKQKRMI